MATKKAETKTTDAIVWDPAQYKLTDELFDAWTDEAEEEAIAAAAAAADVKHIIVEGKLFAGRFPDGTIVRAPLTFSVSDLEAITDSADNPVDQIKALFKRLGDEESVERLEEQSLTSTVIYAERFFATFARIAEVAMGKSSAS